jgi:transporter family-2 protein
VVATIVLAPRLGAATLVAAVVAGQMLASVLLDQYGLVGFPVHPLSALRLLGAGLVIGGVILVQR